METVGDNCGYFHSLQEAYTFILELETQLTTKFTCHKADKGFGAIDYNQRPHKVCWEDRKDAEGAKITFTAVPFIYLGCKLYDCQHGVDRKAASKQRMKDKTQARFVLVKLQNIMG